MRFKTTLITPQQAKTRDMKQRWIRRPFQHNQIITEDYIQIHNIFFTERMKETISQPDFQFWKLITHSFHRRKSALIQEKVTLRRWQRVRKSIAAEGEGEGEGEGEEEAAASAAIPEDLEAAVRRGMKRR